MGVGGKPHAPATSTPEKDPVPVVQEAGWAPGPRLDGGKISSPPGFDLGSTLLVKSKEKLPSFPPPPLILLASYACVSSHGMSKLKNRVNLINPYLANVENMVSS